MNANPNERRNSPADREAFEQAIRDNLSPDGVATAIACRRNHLKASVA